uniref:Crossover junction endonuclease MUS81 n=1 Tax=Aceria tosichella TaxID=561515 RepID=A0A6G1SF74_9ACAR
MPRPPFMNNNYRRAKKKYVYIPAPASGAHAILVSMFKAENDDLIKNMDKQQILNYCNKYSQSSLKDNSKIWACMKGLIDKSLVGRQISRDPIYFLLDEGRDLAEKLVALAEGKPLDDETSQDTDNNTNSNSEFTQSSQRSTSNPYEPEMMFTDGQSTFELKAGTYDIILVVDQRERISIICPDNSVRIENVNLACGDFVWIARPKNAHPYDRTKDLVLDYVVERKRLDDLQASIMDGRYEQQKYRLLNSGMRRPVYLIEEFGLVRPSMTSSSLNQAVVNMFAQDGINVERSKSAQHTNDYLIGMTKCLRRYYLNKDLRSCTQEKLKQNLTDANEMMTFSEFQVVGAKITNWTVREMFAKHLIQITGMSDKRVAVIIKKYPTISALMDAYRQCSSEKDKENLLSKLSIPDSNRTIGPKLSQRVYTAYAMPKNLEI